MKKIFSLVAFSTLMLWGVQAQAQPSEDPADYSVTMLSTDFTTWPGTVPAMGDTALFPAENMGGAKTGTYDIIGGWVTFNGTTNASGYMGGNRPHANILSVNPDIRWYRIDGQTTVVDNLPTSEYVEFESTTPFYNGGIISITFSVNNATRGLDLYGVNGNTGFKIGTTIDAGNATNALLTKHIALPETLRGFTKIRVVRNGTNSLLYGFEMKTNPTPPPVNVLYLTNNANATADDSVQAALKRNFNVRVSNAANGAPSADSVTQWNADNNIDVIVYSEYGNNLNNNAHLKNSTKPVLIMKGHALVENRLAWSAIAGNSDGGAIEQNEVFTKSIKVAAGDQAHALYNGLTFVGDSVKLLSEIGMNSAQYKGLIAISNKVAPEGLGILASPPAARPATDAVQAVFYHPAGTLADGTAALAADWCFIGMSSNSYNFVTANFKQLLVNAVYKLSGGVSTGTEEASDAEEPEVVSVTITTPPSKTLTLSPGSTSTLVATVVVTGSADNAVQWSSSDLAVATVDAVTGVVTAVAEGVATITATSVADGTKSDACVVTVESFSGTPIKVAYVTTAAQTVATDSIFKLLDRNFIATNVVFSGAGTQVRADSLQNTYDVVVLSPYYGGGDLKFYENMTKPVLVFQGAIMPDDNTYYNAPVGPASGSRWAWVTSRIGHIESGAYEQLMVFQKSIEVSDVNANLYKGLKLVGNTARLLDSIAKSGDNGMLERFQGLITTGNPKTGSLKAKVIPAVTNNDNSYAVYFQAAGNVANGTDALLSSYCYIGLSSQSIPFINANMKQLIVNAVKVLVDSVPTGTEETAGVAAPAVTSVSLSATLALRVPAIQRLTATVAADKLADNVVRWSSSNPAVATVDQFGNVQAVGAGSATITATCADGVQSAPCSVTVSGAAEVLLSEDFTDWVKRTSKLNLVNTDSTPNYASGVNMNNDVTISRPLKGSAAGSVDFMLRHTSVIPFAGSKLLNISPGMLTPTGSGNNNLTGTVTPAPNPPTDATQGAEGAITYEEAGIIISQVNYDVKTIELELSMFGEGRLVKVSKSYDGTNWVCVDADAQSGSEGRLNHFVTKAQIAEKYIINLPRAERNFYLRIGPGKSYNQLNNAAQTQRFNLHSVKYYAPNTSPSAVQSVAISDKVLPTGASLSANGDTIRMVAPATWCMSAGTVKLSYACTPADATNTTVSWSSNNPAVATVDPTGNVSPVSAGEAKITVTTVDGSHTATINVRVSADAATAVDCPETVTINKVWSTTFLEVYPDSTYQLTATVKDGNGATMAGKTVTYASLNDFTEITTGGLLKALNKGWGLIVATVVTDNETGRRVTDTLDVRILAPIYIGGAPAPDEGAPNLPIAFNARVTLSPTQRMTDDPRNLDEEWAESYWFNFAVTGLRPQVSQDTGTYTKDDIWNGFANINLTRPQGVYINQIVEDGNTPDFANIGMKGSKAMVEGGKGQSRLVFAFNGELDSLKLGVVLNGATQPTSFAIQESNDALSWSDLHYIINAASSIKENEVESVWTELKEKEYAYPVIRGFSPNSRFIRLWQLESGRTSSAAHNIYFDGIWLYGGGGGGGEETGIVRQEMVANYGISVYPNPTSGTVYVEGEKAIARVDVVSLHSGQLVKRAPQGGAATALLQLDDLANGVYLVVIFVEGSSKPQVVKISKQ